MSAAVTAFARTLDQELLALSRGASLECLACGEFVMRLRGVLACPECRPLDRELLDGWLAPSAPQMTEAEFEQWLFERKIIGYIPSRVVDPVFEANRKPIEIEGKPVSEIILEERR